MRFIKPTGLVVNVNKNDYDVVCELGWKEYDEEAKAVPKVEMKQLKNENKKDIIAYAKSHGYELKGNVGDILEEIQKHGLVL